MDVSRAWGKEIIEMLEISGYIITVIAAIIPFAILIFLIKY